MNVPVTDEMVGNRSMVDVRIEETVDVSYDLSGEGEYVDIGRISGRLVTEFDVSRGAILEEVERAESVPLRDKIRAVLDEWDPDAIDTSRVTLDYGQMLFRGSEPITGASTSESLESEIQVSTVQENSPEDVKRQLRREMTYSTTYEELSEDIRAYLEREGIQADSYEMGAPVHIQARAEPIAEGTDEDARLGTEFTITLENLTLHRIEPSTLEVEMPPIIGRELELEDGTEGSYDPADEVFVFDVPSILGVNADDSSTELVFLVPPSAGRALEELSGTVTLNVVRPFSGYAPEAVYDAGGHLLYHDRANVDSDLVTVRSTCSIEGEFRTPTEKILVGDETKVQKRISVHGVHPAQADNEVEEVLTRRGLDVDTTELKENDDLREGEEVTKLSKDYQHGSVVVNGTRVAISIEMTGERRTGTAESSRGEGEQLPAQRRNVSKEFGRTGLTIIGRGAVQETVDEYVTDLANDLELALESISEEV